MALIAVTNLKGGCGKSSIAVNLACALSQKATVSLVDADSQGTASFYCANGRFPVSCAHAPLDDPRHIERWVRHILSIPGQYVVLDAPPHIGAVTKAIVGIVDLVLIPCTASTADLVATLPAVQLVQAARAARADRGPRCLLVPSRVDRRTTSGRELAAALARFGEAVAPAIHQRAAFVDAFTAGQWIGDFAPGSAAHSDIQQLAQKVLQSTRPQPARTRKGTHGKEA